MWSRSNHWHYTTSESSNIHIIYDTDLNIKVGKGNCDTIFTVFSTTLSTFNSCTKCVGSASIILTVWLPPVGQFPWHGWPHIWTYLWFARARWVIDVLGLLFQIVIQGVWTTRHWQTSGRLVQELSVCTVVCLTTIFREQCLQGNTDAYWKHLVVVAGTKTHTLSLDLQRVKCCYCSYLIDPKEEIVF